MPPVAASAGLHDSLAVLASGIRLEMLRVLQEPRRLSDIRLHPAQPRAGMNPRRPMSRQALQSHLARLVEAGLVVVRDAGAAGKEYQASPQGLYRVQEELRRVGHPSLAPAAAAANRDATMDLGAPRPTVLPPGPKLLLVHGLPEGQGFALRDADLRDGRGWVLGRKPDVHVSLTYDPYVSLENAEILREDGRHVLVDLRSSKNGTWLNWRRLGWAEKAPLEAGDVVGVGRTLLVFRTT